jgi:NAD(P)-dependent dehydrogenase (short-subunit alcohol dehydrogenase family)
MKTKQAPLPSGLGASTTAREVMAARDLRGRVAIVTGGHAGIGLETTRVLADAGAVVVVGARSLDKARASLAGVPRVEVVPLDLIDPASVDAFAARFLASDRPLHLLINNAGIMATPLERDARGYESQLATNHFGHFQLTARLWPALGRANGARVVALSSRGHAYGGVDFDDPFFDKRPYDKWQAYGQSKSANALFAVALDARGAPRGVRVFAVHPGAIHTELTRSLSEEEMRVLLASPRIQKTTFKTVEQGAATTVWCATSPQLDGMGGVYCEDADISPLVAPDFDGTYGVRAWAVDPDIAERLWTKSEEWTGARFA